MGVPSSPAKSQLSTASWGAPVFLCWRILVFKGRLMMTEMQIISFSLLWELILGISGIIPMHRWSLEEVNALRRPGCAVQLL